MDFELLEKMKVEDLNDYLKIRGLKVTGTKKELVDRVFAAVENGVQPVKKVVETESDLITDYKNNLKIDDFPIPDPFKIPHGWMEEHERMAFWPMLSYPDVFNFLMFYPSELARKDLSVYKNSKAYSYNKSGWLQPLQYHNLSGSKYCIIRGECRKSQSIKDPFHKLWIILEKTAKIRTWHCACMVGNQERNHVAATMYHVEAALRIVLTNPSSTSKANEWLQIEKLLNRKR